MASTSYCVLHVYNSGALRYKRSLSSKENEEEATCRRRGGRDSAINGISQAIAIPASASTEICAPSPEFYLKTIRPVLIPR